jgi:hypothetical protein
MATSKEINLIAVDCDKDDSNDGDETWEKDLSGNDLTPTEIIDYGRKILHNVIDRIKDIYGLTVGLRVKEKLDELGRIEDLGRWAKTIDDRRLDRSASDVVTVLGGGSLIHIIYEERWGMNFDGLHELYDNNWGDETNLNIITECMDKLYGTDIGTDFHCLVSELIKDGTDLKWTVDQILKGRHGRPTAWGYEVGRLRATQEPVLWDPPNNRPPPTAIIRPCIIRRR